MKHINAISAVASLLLAAASTLAAAEFKLKVAYGANAIQCGLAKNVLQTPYVPLSPSATAPRIYFTYGGDADDPSAQDFENLATFIQVAADAATWTLFVENAPATGTALDFSFASGDIPQNATLRIADIDNPEYAADISDKTQFTVQKDCRYAIQFAEPGQALIPPAPENQNLLIYDTPQATCQFSPNLPQDPSYAVLADESAVAYRSSSSGDLEVALKNVGTVTYDDATNVCTFTLPDDVPSDWVEVHFNYCFSNGVTSTANGTVFVSLEEDPTPRLQFKTGTEPDKLLPEDPSKISINTLKYDIVSNEAWTLTKNKDADWLTLATTRGYGNGTIYFTVSPLSFQETPTRYADIHVTSDSGLTLDASVTQTYWPDDVEQDIQRTPGNSIKLNLDTSPDSSFYIVADASATAYSLDDSGTSLIVQENVGTVAINNATRTYTYTLPDDISEDWNQLRFSYSFSNGTLATDDAEVVLTLTEPPYLRFKQGTVTPKSIPADVDDIPQDSLLFYVESNEDWTVKLEKDTEWLTLKTPSGSNNAPVYFSVQSNLQRGASRTNDFVITSTSGKQLTYTVIQQAGQEPFLALSPEAHAVPGFASDVTVKISSNIDWSVSTADLPDWLAFTPNSGSDSQTVTIHVAANTDAATRSADVLFISENLTSPQSATCTFTQDGTCVSTFPRLYAGWNLIALDAYPVDSAALLGNGIFAYDMVTSTSVAVLEPGKPYWLYTETPCEQHDFTAYPLPSSWQQTTLSSGKWRAIGVARAMETPACQALWTWDAATQRFAPRVSLEPTHAYWYLP